MSKLHKNAPILAAMAIVISILGFMGCAGMDIAGPDDQPSDVVGVMKSLQGELSKLSSVYPELSESGDIKVISAADGSAHTVAYRKNCTFSGKQGYRDTGAYACAVALRVVTAKRFQEDVRKVAMPAPTHTWTNLKLVGWTTVHIGKQPSVGFEQKIKQLIGEHVAMINDLDTSSAAK